MRKNRLAKYVFHYERILSLLNAEIDRKDEQSFRQNDVYFRGIISLIAEAARDVFCIRRMHPDFFDKYRNRFGFSVLESLNFLKNRSSDLSREWMWSSLEMHVPSAYQELSSYTASFHKNHTVTIPEMTPFSRLEDLYERDEYIRPAIRTFLTSLSGLKDVLQLSRRSGQEGRLFSEAFSWHLSSQSLKELADLQQRIHDVDALSCDTSLSPVHGG